MPAGSFLSCPREEEKITLKVKQSKPATGYMTPSLHTSFRKEIFLRLLENGNDSVYVGIK